MKYKVDVVRIRENSIQLNHDRVKQPRALHLAPQVRSSCLLHPQGTEFNLCLFGYCCLQERDTKHGREECGNTKLWTKSSLK